ncbi:MarR family winged helix-turn-helix transcriptional regulator [Psychroserpens sp.]
MIEIPSKTIFFTIEKAIKNYRKYAQKQINKKVKNITIDQALLLLFLHKNPNLSQSEIADLIFKEKASVTRMIEIMKKNKLLNRRINNNDRRGFKLNITKKGLEILNLISPIISTNREVALNDISKSEILQIDNALNKIIKNCKSKKE